MTASDPGGPDRFRFLATFIAGRSVDIAEAPAGEAAHTNGRVIFVSAGASGAEQRRETLIQSALLGAGSLDQRLVKSLRARPSTARRYLALEGRRVLTELAKQLPLAATLRAEGEPITATADESLEMARSRAEVANAPQWFGVIKPSRLLASSAGQGTQATDKDLRSGIRRYRPARRRRRRGRRAVRGKQDTQTVRQSALHLTDFLGLLRKMFGNSRSQGDGAAGAELQVRSVRRAARPGRMPGRFPPGSVSPMTGNPALQLAWAAPCTRNGMYTTTDTGLTGAGSSIFR